MSEHPKDTPELPPDPWAEQGIDPWALEQAELLTRTDADPSSRSWDEIDGPTLDEFEEAKRELASWSDEEDDASGLLGALRPWLGAIALIVVLAFVLTYVVR